jgi:hypothetical protein
MARPRKVAAVAAVEAPVTTAPAVVQEVKKEIPAPVVEVQKPTAPVKAKPYFLGTTDDCPLWNLNLGGVTFHRETAELIPAKRGDDDILQQGPPVRGHLEMLTPDSIERIKKAARTKVVRWAYPPRWEDVVDPNTGAKSRVFKGNGRIYSSGPRGPDAPQFVQQDGDEPIGKYIYCVPTESLDATFVLGDRKSIQVKTVHEAMEDGTL